MKKAFSITIVIVATLILFSCKPKNKMVVENGKSYFYDASGKKISGWKEIEGDYYYFNKENNEKTVGWYEIDSVWYCFDKDGIMQRDKFVDGFYVDEEGKMVRNSSKTIDGKIYYFDENGNSFDKPLYSINITNNLPAGFVSWFGKVIITAVDCEVIDNRFHLYFTGECNYGYRQAGDGLKPRQVAYNLTDPEGYVFDSGILTTDNMKNGDKFKRKEIILKKENNVKGEYKLSLSDVDIDNKPINY